MAFSSVRKPNGAGALGSQFARMSHGRRMTNRKCSNNGQSNPSKGYHVPRDTVQGCHHTTIPFHHCKVVPDGMLRMK